MEVIRPVGVVVDVCSAVVGASQQDLWGQEKVSEKSRDEGVRVKQARACECGAQIRDEEEFHHRPSTWAL